MKRSLLLRSLVALIFIALTVLGLRYHIGWGTISSFGWDTIAAVCPLGGLEAMLAGRSVTVKILCALGIVVLLVVVFGRAFCGWICPLPLSRRSVGLEVRPAKRVIAIHADPASDKRRSRLPYWILGGALASSAVFGFPVFCLICPVGLTFALLISLWQLFAFNDPTWGIAIFAVILVIEVFLLRKWCVSLCPLGALMSLLSRLNRSFRPWADPQRCLRHHGYACEVCRSVCPEGIDPAGENTPEALSRCIKCRLCADACPARALSFPFRNKVTRAAPPPAQKAPAAPPPPPRRQDGDRLAAAIAESQRCLECGHCVEVCPQRHPIPALMSMMRENRPRAAGEALLLPGVMPEVCARVCPSSRLCRSACQAAGGPIDIPLVEGAATELALRRGVFESRPWPARRRVAVIGAGPSGLACAAVLRSHGLRVEIFDRAERVGGLMVSAILPRKLPPEFSAERAAELRRRGVVFHLEVTVGKDISYTQLREDFSALYLATGAGDEVAPRFPGADRPGVLTALVFLADVIAGSPRFPLSGRRVVVLGGGYTAADCLGAALTAGAASATCLARRPRATIRLDSATLTDLEARGATFVCETVVKEIRAVASGQGHELLADQAGTAALFQADLVISAYGFRGVRVAELESLGVRYDERGRISADPVTGQTGDPAVYAGGDAVRGPSLVVTALEDGRRVGEAIARALSQRS